MEHLHRVRARSIPAAFSTICPGNGFIERASWLAYQWHIVALSVAHQDNRKHSNFIKNEWMALIYKELET